MIERRLVNGKLVALTAEESAERRDDIERYAGKKFPRLVNRERDRRVQAGFIFDGVLYQFDPASQARIAAVSGVAGSIDWIAADNSVNSVSAFELARAAREWLALHMMASRRIKDAGPVDDVTDDKLWPDG